MKKLSTIVLLSSLLCANFASIAVADTLIYGNSGWEGGLYLPMNSDLNHEFMDYGSSSGGLVSKFEIGYGTTKSNPGTLYISFWEGTTRWNRGNLIKTITLTDLDGFSSYKEYTIPEEDRFVLPPGNFGYSYEFAWSYDESGPLLASGGLSNENYFWVYQVNTWYGQQQVGDGYAGFYMKVYTGPALADITCDITGNKFDDANGNGVWDAGEPALGGWEIYADTNGNDQYDPGIDPNVVTDPNGGYFFENLEFEDPNETKTFVIREVMQDGWTQTLPGGPDYEYTIVAEPNNVYTGYDFGNTDQPVTKYGGGDGTPGNPYQIWTATHMNQIGTHQEDWDRHFILMDDIDMSGITGEQYNIIGYHNSTDDYLHFTGTFDGNNRVIQNFSYTTSVDKDQIGIFGYTEGAQIINLTLTNVIVSVIGDRVGGLVGTQKAGTITNCHFNGSVTGMHFVGGLCGLISEGVIDQCSSQGTVTALDQGDYIGGLIGGLSLSTASNCFSTADVYGDSDHNVVGGLIGWQIKGSIADCYATGTILLGIDCTNIGGLVGGCDLTTTLIERCYSSGDVICGANSESIGGLVGGNSNGLIKNSFCTGNVSSPASSYLGGLVARNYGTISHCYSMGDVTGNNQSNHVGGFTGESGGGYSVLTVPEPSQELLQEKKLAALRVSVREW